MNPLFAYSVRNQSCPNSTCDYFGMMMRGNVVVHACDKPRFKCKLCNRTWMFNFGEPLFGLRTEYGKINLARVLLEEGSSVRFVAKELRVSPSTVQRWKKRFVNFNS